REVRDRGDDAVRLDARRLDRVRTELAGAYEDGMHPDAVRADHVGLEVVTDHPGHRRLGVECATGGVEVRGTRLAEYGRRGLGRVLEAGDVTTGVEQRPALRLPPAVAVQAVEVGPQLELGEGA